MIHKTILKCNWYLILHCYSIWNYLFPDADVEDLTDRDLDHQFEVVKTNTPNSPVTRYGDQSYTDMKVIEFQGNANQKSRKTVPKATKASRADRVLSYEVPYTFSLQQLQPHTVKFGVSLRNCS